jgi:hypothetical protein
MTMRTLFILIGLLFDLVILALAAAVIYVVIQPSMLFDNIDIVRTYLKDITYRAEIGVTAGVFFAMAFRGVFLLLFGNKDRVFTIKDTEHGALTVSRSTLERIVSRIASGQAPAAAVASIAISQLDSSLRMRLKIKLEINKTNLGEYIAKFDQEVRGYFKDSLGIQLSRLDIEAAAADPESADSA